MKNFILSPPWLHFGPKTSKQKVNEINFTSACYYNFMQKNRKNFMHQFLIKLEKSYFGLILASFWPQNLKKTISPKKSSKSILSPYVWLINELSFYLFKNWCYVIVQSLFNKPTAWWHLLQFWFDWFQSVKWITNMFW